MKAALIKLLASLMSDGENGKRLVVLLLSIAVGFLGLMFLPIAVLAGLKQCRRSLGLVCLTERS